MKILDRRSCAHKLEEQSEKSLVSNARHFVEKATGEPDVIEYDVETDLHFYDYKSPLDCAESCHL